MRNWIERCTLAAVVAFAALANHALAGDPALGKQLIANGLDRPIWVGHAPGDFDRIFIIEHEGAIRIVKDGSLLATPFLDIDPIVQGGTSGGNEQGLLGLAFHPNYDENGYFYVYYIGLNAASESVLARYEVSDADPDIADPNSAFLIMTFDQPFTNHNGGWLAFDSNGYLNLATGDGGSGNDPSENAQDITNQRLGKILRIDVDGDDFPADPNRNYAIPPENPFVGVAGDDEILHYGLRNPYRCSLDRETGDLWIGDVGQDAREEISFAPAGSTGLNFGWDCMEGTLCLTNDVGCSCADPDLVDPVYDYVHEGFGGICTVIGGYVYRGCAIPDLHGTYFLADYCSTEVWSFQFNGSNIFDFQERTSELGTGSLSSITTFGEDAYGEIYFTDMNGGQVFKIRSVATIDCNENNIQDACEILDGSVADANGDGVPDECDAPVINIVASDPPDNAIDARQPSEPDGSNPAGWDSIELTFDGATDGVVAGDFEVSEQGGDGVAPGIADVTNVDESSTLAFTGLIEAGAWTTITHVPSGTSVRIGFLPADVNNDQTSTAGDILSLIDSLNGQAVLAQYQTDIDRSGVSSAADVLRAIDLLNGANEYAVWNLVSLPD